VVKLADPANGAFNVTSWGAATRVSSTEMTVTNLTSTGSDTGGGYGAYVGPGGILAVTGNITAQGASGTGVYAYSGGKVTVDGTITVQSGGTYIRVGSKYLTKDQYSATSSKAGYPNTNGSFVVVLYENNKNGPSCVLNCASLRGSAARFTARYRRAIHCEAPPRASLRGAAARFPGAGTLFQRCCAVEHKLFRCGKSAVRHEITQA